MLFVIAAIFGLGPFADEELTPAEFIGRGDQICKEAHDAFVDLQEAQPQTGQEAADLSDQLASIAADESDQIAELDRPAELDALVDRYLEARARGIDALEAGADAVGDDDGEAYRAQKRELLASQDERRRLATQIGFAECSRQLPGA